MSGVYSFYRAVHVVYLLFEVSGIYSVYRALRVCSMSVCGVSGVHSVYRVCWQSNVSAF